MPVREPPRVFWAYFPIGRFRIAVNRSWRPGDAATSWFRSPRENAAVGGHPWSQHLVGLAADLVSPEPGRLAARLRAEGLVVVVEADHVHVQAWPAGTLERLFS
jgi:hypothetical protein